MKNTKIRALAWWAIAAVLVILALTGFVVGKYMMTVTAGNGTIKVNARLATSMKLQESKAVRRDNGKYTLSETQYVAGNAYILIPGVDIPKDPHVVITGKTEIPAYLYVKVTCNNDAISYTLRDYWVPTGESDTYVYSDQNGDPIPLTTTPGAIYIFEDDMVYVSHELLEKNRPTDPIALVVTLKEVTN